MPTLTFSLRDVRKLIGKTITVKELQHYCEFAKGDFEGHDRDSDDVKIDFGDTNLPYVWSVEGFSLLIKGIMGKEKGIPKLKIHKGKYAIKVDPSVKKIRPFISAFVAKGGKIDNYLLKQLIQLQEKLADNYGRRRDKIAIGIYPFENIEFPLTYKAVKPESVHFVPLDLQRELSLKRILKEHPKGVDYAHTIKDFNRYPVLMDNKKEVLSFIPIINSAHLGRVKEDSTTLFFEATGTDQDAVHLVTTIFAQALHERKFAIHSVDVKYPKKVTTPLINHKKVKLNYALVKEMLGLELKKAEIKKWLERMRYDVKGDYVVASHLRGDMLHQADIIEDIAISYDFNDIPSSDLEQFTIGHTFPITRFINTLRELFVGLGYQESFSPILSNKNDLYARMNTKDTGTVEIEEYMSENFCVVRSWLLPTLMSLLSKNKHVEYPHRVFEQGLVTTRNRKEIKDHEKLAAVTAHEKADFTEIKQSLDALFSNLDVRYTLKETEHHSFISGRAASVFVNDKDIGIIGEIAPEVLEQFNLAVPVAALELNVSELFGQNKK